MVRETAARHAFDAAVEDEYSDLMSLTVKIDAVPVHKLVDLEFITTPSEN